MMVSTQSPLNLVRGPAKKPEWAQLIRLGGDRVAILFKELRKEVGRLDGIVERLHYLESEARWVVQYDVGAAELFTVRVLPGLLEASMPLSRSDIETLVGTRNLSGTIKNAICTEKWRAGMITIRLVLTNHRMIRSFANLVKAKGKLLLTAVKPRVI